MYKANLFNSLKAIYDKKRISAISKSNWGNYSLRTNKIFQTLLVEYQHKYKCNFYKRSFMCDNQN